MSIVACFFLQRRGDAAFQIRRRTMIERVVLQR